MHQDKIEGLTNEVFGNGRPGLRALIASTRADLQKEITNVAQIAQHTQTSIETSVKWLRIIATMLAAVGLPAVGWFTVQFLRILGVS